ncbi:fimbrial protein [Lelliottia amnigena]|uniref:fimbrial protein n=1 Tax=Lelliottia amnigena TaxID=61646 RepID=UPI0021DA98E5|nr:fimbrial protein [Lelliottia amnigena]MCU7782450.1 fimbrial protein [Lelliottia amnigena]
MKVKCADFNGFPERAIKLKPYVIYLAGMLILLFSFCSKAACTSYHSGDINFNMGDVRVPYNPAVGTVLKEVVVAAPRAGADGCSIGVADGYSKYTLGSPTGQKYGENDIYSTNIPGVGFAICYADCNSAITRGAWYPFVTLNDPELNSWVEFNGFPWHFLLVVTGDVNNSGPITLGQYGESGIAGNAMARVVLTGGTIKATECDLEQDKALIDFGGLPAEQFTSVGKTTQEKNFDIGLTCDGQANISVALEGQQNAETSDTSILALTNSGSQNIATGLGAQILYNNSPLKLNEKIALKTTTGNVLETFSFSARYYQTKSVVTPGEANVVATLSITHQ